MRILSILLLLPVASLAQNDESYTKKILEYTTEKFFLTELVDHLPASGSVPTPEKVLGYMIGTPNKLTYSADCARYLRALAAATPRVKVFSMGKSEEGREMVVAVVSDEANLTNLDRWKQINRKLGDPRSLKSGEEEKLISEGLPMYWATGAMHSPESASPEMLMELAYRLAVEETPFIQTIRKNSIVMITPVLETDGRDRYVDTYYWRKKNPNKPAIPLVYWGRYVAHDNNRDGLAISLALSRNVMRTWLDFRPQVLHDLHESMPYLYVSTGTGPYNAWLDPITIDEWNLMAYNEVGEMTRRGVPGVWTYGFYDGWAPNYMFYAANGHNAIGRFYETFGGSGADSGIRSAGNTSREWFRPNPPFPRVKWSIRNNINLQQSAILLGMNFVASNKERFLRNYYLKSKRSVEKARKEGPAAYVIPASENHIGQKSALVEMLKRQGIEIYSLDEDANTKDGKFGRGSIVIRMDQPYSRMADMLLDKQFYNPADPQPYDDTGWTLGPLFNVQTVRCKDVAILDYKMSPMTSIAKQPAVAGNFLIIKNTGDFSLTQLRYRLPNAKIYYVEKEFKNGATTFPQGTWLAPASNDLVAAVSDLGIETATIAEMPKVPTHEVKAARIAIVHSWMSTQDDGWFRLAFEQLGVPYRYVSVHEVRDVADLKSKYDVLIFPPGMGDSHSIVNGITKEGEPIPWKPMPGFPNLGGPDTSDNIRGGMELQGVVNLQRFLQNGGLVITVGESSSLPIDYGLTNGVSIVQSNSLRAPGGVFATDVSGESPIISGYGDKLGVYFSEGPLLSMGGAGLGRLRAQGGGRSSGRGDLNDPDVVQGRAPYTPGAGTAVEEGFGGPRQQSSRQVPKILLRFAEEKQLLISGMLQNGNELAGKPAVIVCPAEKGNVVMFAINPMWRMETQGSYQLLFNAIMNYSNLTPK